MKLAVFAFILVWSFAIQAAKVSQDNEGPSDACAGELGDTPSIYLQAKLSKPPQSEREDRLESTKLPGREGNLQRYLEAQARPLSKEAKLLAERISFFIRAGRLDFPSSEKPLSNQELADLLIQTEEYIEEQPPEVFDVPTPSSFARRIEARNRSHQQLLEVFAGFAQHSSDGGQAARTSLASAERRHKIDIKKLQETTPAKIADLISNTNKNDLSAIFNSLRAIFLQRHPIFGDVRTDTAYPKIHPHQARELRRSEWQELGVEEEPNEEPMTLEDLIYNLNPPPVALETQVERAQLAELRDTYTRLINSLDVFEGVTYWGTDQSGDVVTKLVPGSIMELKPFYSDVNVFASTPYYNKAVANLLQKKSWPHLILYKINGRNGRLTEKFFDTSTFPDVIFLPGTEFRVDSHEFFDGIHYVEITEVTGRIATQPKEQELRVLLNRQIRVSSELPERIRDLSGRTWRVWYDTEPGFKRSFSAYAWRTLFSDLGIASVDAFRLSLDNNTMAYIEEVLDLPHLKRVPAKSSKQYLTPSLLALTSAMLGDRDIYNGKISVYDRGGGRWVANGFWERKALTDSLAVAEIAPFDTIIKAPIWKPFFKNQDTAFFLQDQIHTLDPVERENPLLENQLRAIAPNESELVEQHLRAIKTRLDSAERFIRHQYVYPRTQERHGGGMVTM